MSNRPDPANQRPASSTDRPTAAYPAAAYLSRLGHEEAAHRERLADLWADRTPTEELPAVARSARSGRPARSVRTRGEARRHPRPAPFVRTTGPRNEGPIQDMGRPGVLARPSMRWHPSLMQLAIGAALVAALLGALQLLALDGISSARQAATEQARSQAARPASQQTPSTLSTTAPKPTWTVHGTDSPYDRTDPSASPLDLPRCTTSPDTPMPCLAHISNDSHHVVVLEEDASLTGLDRR